MAFLKRKVVGKSNPLFVGRAHRTKQPLEDTQCCNIQVAHCGTNKLKLTIIIMEEIAKGQIFYQNF